MTKLLYLECNMGAAGDMLMGALYELLSPAEKDLFMETMQQLNLPRVSISANAMAKCGIWGTKMQILIHNHNIEESHKHPKHTHTHQDETDYTHFHPHHHETEHSHLHPHHHLSYPQVLHQISHLPVPEKVKEHAEAVYRLIGEAEALVHHTSLEQIHFHEVGTLDAIADVVGCCLLIDMLKPDKILSSPIHVGSGTVKCAHGILPVPAPATALLLKNIPIYSTSLAQELCTPTGAAILKHFAADFVPMPPMEISRTGYGMGTKDFPQANCLRAFWGHLALTQKSDDTILELSCCLDDMTGEALGFATEILLENGALDVFTTAVGMKKGRPGSLLTCLCHPSHEAKLSRLLFIHTTTKGIRVKECRRHILTADFQKVQTPYGDITVKCSNGYDTTQLKPEYEDIVKAARAHNVDYHTVYQAALDSYRDRLLKSTNFSV